MTNTTTGTGDASGFDLELNGSDINYVNRTASGNQKFWTNSTERMRIDSSGNLLVGTTDTVGGVTGTTPGVAIRADGGVFFTRANADGLNVNRTSSDGAIAQFRKDGTVVGSIGTAGSSTYITGASSGLRFAATNIMPVNASGSYTNGTSDLGGSTERFKDAHFSGTVNAGSFVGDGSGLTGVGFTTNVTTTNTTASKDNHYYLNAAGITLTLPASPSVGDEVRISEVAGNTDCVIGRNGSNIMSSGTDLTIDTGYTVIYLRYVDATIGWAFS
jgi:hypothetical protein